MKKKFTNMERRGLPGGPNEMFTYTTGVFSTEGYRKDSPDVNNLFNIIDSSDISMQNVEFPVLGIDNLGHTQMMYPGGEYKFQGDQVLEIPMFSHGGKHDPPSGRSRTSQDEDPPNNPYEFGLYINERLGKAFDMMKQNPDAIGSGSPYKYTDWYLDNYKAQDSKYTLQGEERVNGEGFEMSDLEDYDEENLKGYIDLYKDFIKGYQRDIDTGKEGKYTRSNLEGYTQIVSVLEDVLKNPIKPKSVVLGAELAPIIIYGKPTYEDAYKNVDKDKYPTYEDFEFAAKYYNETGTNPDPQDLPSNRLPAPLPPEYQIEDIEPDISPLPIIRPSLISRSDTGEIITPEEEIQYKRKFGFYDKEGESKRAKLRNFLGYRIPELINPKKSRSIKYKTAKGFGFYEEPIEEYQDGGLITYKKDKDLIDSVANWDMQSDVDISSDYNDQIKARLLTGKFGFNPKTGELVKLGKSEQTKVTDKEALETIGDLTETRRDDARQELMDAYTANRKLVAIDKSDEWNPSFIFKDEYGRDVNTRDFAGKQVYMTDAEADAYRDAQVAKNAPIAHAKMNTAFSIPATFTPAGLGIMSMQGAAHLTQDAPELIKDPSLANAGKVGLDLLMAGTPFMVPKTIPNALKKAGTSEGSVSAGIGDFSESADELKIFTDKFLKNAKKPTFRDPEVLATWENFKRRFRTPEGQSRGFDLGLTEDAWLRNAISKNEPVGSYDLSPLLGGPRFSSSTNRLFPAPLFAKDPTSYGYFTSNFMTGPQINLHPKLVMQYGPETTSRVLRHELEHAVNHQAAKLTGESTTKIDDILSNLQLKKKPTPESLKEGYWKGKTDDKPITELMSPEEFLGKKQLATDYFVSGSQGQEKSAFAAELQEFMMQEGIIPKTSYVEITPDMVKQAQKVYNEKPASFGNLRIFDIMKNNESNYDLLSKALNKMIVAVPATAAALSQEKEGGEPKLQGGGWLARYLRDIQPEYEYTFARPGVADPTMGPNFLARSFIGNTTNPRKSYLAMDADVGYATNANLDPYYGNFPLFGGLGLNYIGPRIGVSPVRASLDLQARYSPYKGVMGQFRAAPRIGFKSKKLPGPFNYLEGYVDPLGASYGIGSRPYQWGIENTTPENVNPYNVTSLETEPYSANWGFYSGLNAQLGIGNKRSPFSIFGGLNLNYDPVKGKADEAYTEEVFDLATQSQGKVSTAITPEFRIGVRLDPEKGRSLKDKALLRIEEKKREEEQADRERREREYIESLSNASEEVEEVEEVIDKPESRLDKLRRRRREKQEAKREAEKEMVRHPRFLKDGGQPDPPEKYKVVSGDTFGTIAEKLNIPLSELKELNPLTDTWTSYDNLSLGQMLNLPKDDTEWITVKPKSKTPAGMWSGLKRDFLNPAKEMIAKKEAEEIKKLEELNKPIGFKGQKFTLKDNRKINATSGNKINPNRDLFTGQYNFDLVKKIVDIAKQEEVDPYTMIAIGLQETQLGKSDDNIGHALDGDVNLSDDVLAYIRLYKDKMKTADRLGIGDEATRIQTYNGLGTVKPSTEMGYHGFQMKSIYGVPLTEKGIDMKKNPLYGKRILDLRNNVIMQNKMIRDYVEGNKQKEGGENKMHKIYKEFVNGKYDGTEDYDMAEKIYDKLNRMYYKKAKEQNMGVSNYIMTNIINLQPELN